MKTLAILLTVMICHSATAQQYLIVEGSLIRTCEETNVRNGLPSPLPSDTLKCELLCPASTVPMNITCGAYATDDSGLYEQTIPVQIIRTYKYATCQYRGTPYIVPTTNHHSPMYLQATWQCKRTDRSHWLRNQ